LIDTIKSSLGIFFINITAHQITSSLYFPLAIPSCSTYNTRETSKPIGLKLENTKKGVIMTKIERIDVHKRMIGVILGVITFYGLGFVATIAYYDFIAKAFNSYTANMVVVFEFIVMFALTISVFKKIIMIEKITMEASNG
jgi:hypothetical protein